MQNSQNKKALQIGLFVLVAIVVLGVGYAAISAVNLIINGNATASVDQNNFKVHFIQAQSITGSTGISGTSNIDSQDDTKAMFDVTGLTKVGDYAEAVYTVRNDSNGIGAEITLNLTNSNSEYFKVTETILDDKLQAGEETTVKVRVEMIKTPITDSVSTSITATLTASPLEDAQAAGVEEKEVVKPTPLIYTINGVDDIYINTDISDWTRKYTSFAAAKAESGYPSAIAHEIEDGRVQLSYLVFERNGKVYYLKGRINEKSLPVEEREVYNANIAILKEAFSPDWEIVCKYTGVGNSTFTCDDDNLNVRVSEDGYITSNYNSSWYCVVSGGGGSTCKIL